MFSLDEQTICFDDGTKYNVKPLTGPKLLDLAATNCCIFKGKDIDNKNVIITSWSFDLESMHPKCPINCDVRGPECNHTISEITEEFEKRAKFTIDKVHHINLIPYLNVKCDTSNGCFNVILVQEHIEGVCIKKLFDQSVVPNLPLMAESVLKMISHLHSMDPKMKHGHVDETTIYLDKSGVYRAADYHLIPYLIYLQGLGPHPATVNDLEALGFLMEYGNIKTQRLMKDFIHKCCMEKNQSCWDLLTHELLANAHSDKFNPMYDGPFLRHFDIEDTLGRGSFGSVIKAKHSNGQESYALKLVEIPKGSKHKSGKVKREVELISQLNHKNVIKYVRSWEEEVNSTELPILNEESSYSSSSALDKQIADKLKLIGVEMGSSCSESSSTMTEPTNISDSSVVSNFPLKNMLIIQMELCDKTLKAAMEEYHTARKPLPHQWFMDITHGLTYLHYNEIIHRDLNPKNILLDSLGRMKIADFGLATTTELLLQQKTAMPNTSNEINSSQTGMVGTSYYVAPELKEAASKSTYGRESDVYSLGMIFFEMKHPRFGTNMERHEVLTKARSNIFPDFMQNPYEISLAHTIKQMLDHDPNKRPVSSTGHLLHMITGSILYEVGDIF